MTDFVKKEGAHGYGSFLSRGSVGGPGVQIKQGNLNYYLLLCSDSGFISESEWRVVGKTIHFVS